MTNEATQGPMDLPVMRQARETSRFLGPSWLKISPYPANILPVGSRAISQADETGSCTVKGFYDPTTGETHIQEVVHKAEMTGAAGSRFF